MGAVIAPSLIPQKPGDRIEKNRRDGEKLARLFRAGELTEIRTSDAAHEPMRDLIHAREAAVKDRTRKRQEIRSFLLRRGTDDGYVGLLADFFEVGDTGMDNGYALLSAGSEAPERAGDKTMLETEGGQSSVWGRQLKLSEIPRR
ncbi:hypothetical protein [Bradyrhizobium sp. DASA03120]|uniref:hypothetical protein n=1 Tax=Bradyrhizobium sp. SMVTL-02 TaxID=3395917 RepID=UPI003F72513E